MVQARDGTSCKYSSYRGVCVDGKCEVSPASSLLRLSFQTPSSVSVISKAQKKDAAVASESTTRTQHLREAGI